MLPLIIVAIILAVQNLKDMSKGGSKLALYTVLYYVCTTTIGESCLTGWISLAFEFPSQVQSMQLSCADFS